MYRCTNGIARAANLYYPARVCAANGQREPGEAARDTASILGKLAGIVENRVKPKLEEENMWSREHEEALQKLQEMLKASSPGAT